jgi:activating signal cointegrator complex subunit 3
VVIDEIHMLGQDRGPTLEVIVSRMNYMAAHVRHPVRLVGLSTALANAHDVAAWLGVDKVRPKGASVPTHPVGRGSEAFADW